MPQAIPVTETILAEYDLPRPVTCSCLGNAGGFSGVTIWKVSTPAGCYCLRRWPAQLERKKIDWLHKVLCFARANGCPEVVFPLATKTGATYLDTANTAWELSHWASGAADFLVNPNQRKLESAIECLARFHNATARYHFNFAPSNNVTTVVSRLAEFVSANSAIERNWKSATINMGLTTDEFQDFKLSGGRIAESLQYELNRFKIVPLPVQPVIRDIRAEHLFFANDRITNIIDFGAIQIDSVACDLSRMLGSMFGDDKPQIQMALEHYSSLRALSDAEQELVFLMNKASVLVGIQNWLEWIFVQHRTFDSVDDVRTRLRQLFGRMESYI